MRKKQQQNEKSIKRKRENDVQEVDIKAVKT